MLKRVFIVSACCFALIIPTTTHAQDINAWQLTGNVFRLKVFSTVPGNVVYRVEMKLAVDTDTLRTVPFDCSYSDRDSVCQSAKDLFPGCETQTSVEYGGDGFGTLVKSVECIEFDKPAGACIQVEGYHTGTVLQSTGLAIANDGDCSSVK